MREVAENLKNKELSLDNFTFFKESLGIDDPEKEIIRDAKNKAGPVTVAKKAVAKTVLKISSPKIGGNETADSPLLKTKAAAKSLGNFKIKLPAKKEKKVVKSEEEMETDSTPVKATPNRKSGKWSKDGDKACQPCSIRCEGVHGIIPTLQCRLCLCLYHHECVGLAPHLTLPYVCKNCHLEQGQKPNQSTTIVAPPPLTPINTLKSTGIQSTTLPKLQRIPRTGDTPFSQESDLKSDQLPELPRLTPRPTPVQSLPKVALDPPAIQPAPTESKSLVGSVTTWLPHNSKIVENIQRTNEEPTEAPRPQYVEFLGGRKFLVIPKHNFMSVSPTVAVTATSKPDNNNVIGDVVETTTVPTDSASLGPDPDITVKPEPESPSKPENSQTPEAMEVDSVPVSELATKMEVEQKPAEDTNIVDEKSELVHFSKVVGDFLED
ncbi:hypothetical protein NQ318_005640 [Aromia moschata]|uniref:Zinc finger PHD-type domain-containing protein n=1 Tax=Aromia moschata TaxID=1265417 RepID=A0AAV8XY61_9CUCU|nr:hypothetical protein NQ318_005640 [Aromia moschata]